MLNYSLKCTCGAGMYKLLLIICTYYHFGVFIVPYWGTWSLSTHYSAVLLWLALIQAFPDLPQLSVTSRLIRPTETAGHPSSRSSSASSRPLSPAGSWAGTTTTGPPTPWSVLWLNWPCEISPDPPSITISPDLWPLSLLHCKHWAPIRRLFFICQNALKMSGLFFYILLWFEGIQVHEAVLIHFVSHAAVMPL